MNFYKYVFASFAKRLENLWDGLLGDEKKRLLGKAKGIVLEIGIGTGINLKYYKKGINLIGLEPNPSMYKYLRENAKDNEQKVKIVNGFAEKIPLDDNSVDVVVSTHVLCSVKDVKKVLSEIKRVLKPTGEFIFIEHVASNNKLFRLFQNLVNPIWAFFIDGCQANRDLEESIRSTFENTRVKRKYIKAPTRIIAPHIFGSVRK